MYKPKLKLCTLTLFFIIFTTGCINTDTNVNNSLRNRFIGEWVADIDGLENIFYVTFFSDGTVNIGGVSGEWSLKDGKIVVNTVTGSSVVFSYSGLDNYTSLTTTLPTGDIMTYFKRG